MGNNNLLNQAASTNSYGKKETVDVRITGVEGKDAPPWATEHTLKLLYENNKISNKLLLEGFKEQLNKDDPEIKAIVEELKKQTKDEEKEIKETKKRDDDEKSNNKKTQNKFNDTFRTIVGVTKSLGSGHNADSIIGATSAITKTFGSDLASLGGKFFVLGGTLV